VAIAKRRHEQSRDPMTAMGFACNVGRGAIETGASGLPESRAPMATYLSADDYHLPVGPTRDMDPFILRFGMG